LAGRLERCLWAKPSPQSGQAAPPPRGIHPWGPGHWKPQSSPYARLIYIALTARYSFNLRNNGRIYLAVRTKIGLFERHEAALNRLRTSLANAVSTWSGFGFRCRAHQHSRAWPAQPFLIADCFPQQKIFADENPVPPGKWATAGAAGYFTIVGLGFRFDFDELIKSIAIWTIEMLGSVFVRHSPHP
jgi:hypothetical protein